MNVSRLAIAGIISMGALAIADHASLSDPDTWIGRAEARIGRPATPMSYAGVARRTTRRSIAVGAATAGCATAYNAYGQPISRCY